MNEEWLSVTWSATGAAHRCQWDVVEGGWLMSEWRAALPVERSDVPSRLATKLVRMAAPRAPGVSGWWVSAQRYQWWRDASESAVSVEGGWRRAALVTCSCRSEWRAALEIVVRMTGSDSEAQRAGGVMTQSDSSDGGLTE